MPESAVRNLRVLGRPLRMQVAIPAQPAAPASLSVAGTSETTATVSWAASAGAGGYVLQRSTDGSTWSAAATQPGTSFADSGLSSGTDYFYRAAATSGPVASPWGTVAVGATPCAVPAGLAAAVVSPNEIDLSWGSVVGATGYTLQRSPDGSTWTTIDTPTATASNDTGLSPATDYHYQVSATGDGGTTAYSAPVVATTTGGLPAVPTGLTVGAASATSLAVSWAASGGATGYALERSTDNATWGSPIATPASTSYTDSPLTTGTTYYYRVAATNGAGTSAYGASQSGVPTTNTLLAQALSPTAAKLSLTTSPAGGVPVYTVWQRSTDNATWADVVQMAKLQVALGSSANSFVDAGVAAGGTYYWRAQTRTSAFAAIANSTVAGPIAIPSSPMVVQAPTGLAVSNVTGCSATISWTAAAYSASNGLEDGFTVERSADGGSTWRVVAANLFRGCSYFVDTGLTPGGANNYKWRVTAFNGRTQTGPVAATYANSATSAATSGTTTPAASGSPPADPTWQSYAGIAVTSPSIAPAMAYSDTVVSLEWSLTDATEAGTRVEMAADSAGSPGAWTELFVVGKWIWQTYVTGLAAGTKYWFRARACNAGGSSGYTTATSATTLASGHNHVTDATGAAGAPKMFLTPQQLGIYRQMQADYAVSHTATPGAVFWGNMLAGVAGSIAYMTTGAFPPNGDNIRHDQGQDAAVLYVLTGNPTYADAAYWMMTANTALLTLSNLTVAGTFTLTYKGQTTAPISSSATAATIKSALESLSTIGVGNALTGGTLTGGVSLQVLNQAVQDAYTITTAVASGSFTIAVVTPINSPSLNIGGLIGLPRTLIPGAPALNWLRDSCSIVNFVLDWAGPGWTSGQRQAVQQGIEGYISWYQQWGMPQNTSGMTGLGLGVINDLNQYMNGHFAAALWDVLGWDQTAGTWTLQSYGVPMGGLQPSLASQQPASLNAPFSPADQAAIFGTAASFFAGGFVQYRAGGVGSEGSEYNQFPDVNYHFWAESIRQVRSLSGDANEYHPLLRSAMRTTGHAMMAAYTPDLRQIWGWFDNQNPRVPGDTLQLKPLLEVLYLVANQARGNATVGPVILGCCLEFYGKNNVSPWLNGSSPYFRAYIGIDPYAATQPRTTLPRELAGAMGLSFHRDGHGAGNSLFGCLMNPTTYNSHEHRSFGDFQLYRKGEWALAHPLNYGGLSLQQETCNSMLIGGLGAAGNLLAALDNQQGTQGTVAQQFGASPEFDYHCGSTYGPYYPTSGGVQYNVHPPAFCHEWTRSVVYLPSADGRSDAVVTFDRVLAQNPVYLSAGGNVTASASVTGIVAAGDGNCQVTLAAGILANSQNALGVGDIVNISGVVGTVEANGYHLVKAVTSATVIEIDVPFVNAYASGGTLTPTGTAGYRLVGDTGVAASHKMQVTMTPFTNVPLAANASVPATPGTPALAQWIVHAANTPTISGGTATWTTAGAANYAGNSNLTLVSLMPASAVLASYREADIWAPPYAPSGYNKVFSTTAGSTAYSPECRYQVRAWPSTNTWPTDAGLYWYPFLNVLFAADASGGPTVSATLVQDGGGATAAGPLLHRSGLDDTLLLFSQVASSGAFPSTTFGRVLAAGYTATWTSTTANTDALIFDLSTAKTWTYTLDGGPSTPLPVSSAGVAQLFIAGATPHTLVLTGA